jgi:hypothetical protein
MAMPLPSLGFSLRARFHNFKFDLAVKNFPALLNAIAANPVIASYMVHVNLEAAEYITESDVSPVSDALLTLVRGSKHLADLDANLDEWLDLMFGVDAGEETGTFDRAIAFLLTLLTNVETLLLPFQWRGGGVSRHVFDEDGRVLSDRFLSDPPLRNLIHMLVTRANDKTLKDQPLQKLRALRGTWLDPENEDYTLYVPNTESILPFMALDSLRELQHVGAEYDNKTYIVKPTAGSRIPTYQPRYLELYPTLGKNLETVSLQDYVMTHHGARIFFKDMQRLRSLTLHHCQKDVVGRDWDVDCFLWYLMKYLGGNLERLDISAGMIGDHASVIQLPLHDFEVLRYLTIDTVLFARGYSHHDFDDRQMEPVKKESSHHENYENEPRTEYTFTSKEPWRLVDMLPSSLENLKVTALATMLDFMCLKSIFNGFSDREEQNLPNLNQVTVYMRVRQKHITPYPDYQGIVRHTKAYFANEHNVDFLVDNLNDA